MGVPASIWNLLCCPEESEWKIKGVDAMRVFFGRSVLSVRELQSWSVWAMAAAKAAHKNREWKLCVLRPDGKLYKDDGGGTTVDLRKKFVSAYYFGDTLVADALPVYLSPTDLATLQTKLVEVCKLAIETLSDRVCEYVRSIDDDLNKKHVVTEYHCLVARPHGAEHAYLTWDTAPQGAVSLIRRGSYWSILGRYALQTCCQDAATPIETIVDCFVEKLKGTRAGQMITPCCRAKCAKRHTNTTATQVCKVVAEILEIPYSQATSYILHLNHDLLVGSASQPKDSEVFDLECSVGLILAAVYNHSFRNFGHHQLGSTSKLRMCGPKSLQNFVGALNLVDRAQRVAYPAVLTRQALYTLVADPTISLDAVMHIDLRPLVMTACAILGRQLGVAQWCRPNLPGCNLSCLQDFVYNRTIVTEDNIEEVVVEPEEWLAKPCDVDLQFILYGIVLEEESSDQEIIPKDLVMAQELSFRALLYGNRRDEHHQSPMKPFLASLHDHGGPEGLFASATAPDHARKLPALSAILKAKEPKNAKVMHAYEATIPPHCSFMWRDMMMHGYLLSGTPAKRKACVGYMAAIALAEHMRVQGVESHLLANPLLCEAAAATSTFTCIVCMEDCVNAPVYTASCHHTFCAECMFRAIVVWAEQRCVHPTPSVYGATTCMPCPCRPSCTGHVPDAFVEAARVSTWSPAAVMFSALKVPAPVQTRQRKLKPNTVEYFATEVPCSTCRLPACRTAEGVVAVCGVCCSCTCVECGSMAHPGEVCSRAYGTTPETLLSMAKQQACPGCGLPTTKQNFCNHMTCGACKVHWCWQCGAAMTTGTDVHYRSSPQCHLFSYSVTTETNRMRAYLQNAQRKAADAKNKDLEESCARAICLLDSDWRQTDVDL